MNNFKRIKLAGRITIIAGLAILSFNVINAFRNINSNSLPDFERADFADKLYYPVIPNNMPSEQTMKPSGEFIVSVLNANGNWAETKRLKFDEFFRTQTVDIGLARTVKIEKNGGGEAHLDAVLLGRSFAQQVSGSSDNPVKKLATKDADVINTTNKSIVLTFPNTESSNKLAITGRIEKTVIGKEPLKFPTQNSFLPVTEQSVFYTYKLTPSTIQINANAVFKNANELFKEYCVPGSGHPVSYTYGYVANDNANLYVRIDFTGDNTMDGDKDYTKIYIKTANGLKEFCMSVPEIRWGKPAFDYNEKVAYQHKIYDYTIPLTEIPDLSSTLEMIFEAYGTCSLPSPVITVNPISAATATVNVSVFSYTCSINERGVVYATHSNPTITDSKVINGLTDQSSFSANLTGLLPSTTYYVNLYLTDNNGTYYGSGTEKSFTTGSPVPVSMWSVAFAFIAIGLVTLFATSKMIKKTTF
jgi:hypothetical protein